ncbi:Regulator of chromosome condensation [Amphibalanus amphitrite]|uniref:Regulator of chromosome condensation n=1 Tax=Amphibalanus amphitrite TaxID=1232801 RepID=A0A6A4W9P2_AMPAM|nr:Regulator of chromosome condensation [Amphibalanus amphitrite]
MDLLRICEKTGKTSEPALLTISRRNSVPGAVLTVGEGDTGQLGLGPDTMDCKRVKLVPQLEKDVIDVYAGGMHTLCLTKDGKVYTFGCNDESALGRSTAEEDSEMSPGLVAGLGAPVVQLVAGDSFSAALTEAGEVFVWGTYRDSSGAIGLVEANQQETAPRRLPLEASVAQLAAGSNHLALLDTAGHLYTAGNGEQGQLARVPELFSHRGGRRGLEMLLQPQRVPLGGRGARRARFDRVWAGAFCTVVRDSASGALLGAGLNNYSQLGLESAMAWSLEPMRRFSELSIDEFNGAMHHSVARAADGRVYTLGRKEDGRLGVPGLTADLTAPTLVPKVASMKFRSVSAAGYVTLAVTEDGNLYGWGMGSTGQLGLGDDEDRQEPEQAKGKQLENREVLLVSAGGTHTVLLARDRQQNGH